MKKVTKFFMAALLAGMCSFGYAQDQDESKYQVASASYIKLQPDYILGPQPDEKVIGNVMVERATHPSRPMSPNDTENYSTKERWYQTLLEKAMNQNPGIPVDIRNVKFGDYYTSDNYGEFYYGPARGTIVTNKSPKEMAIDNLPQMLNKALRNVPDGSIMAIDQVTVPYSMDKEELKDQLLDMLLAKDYKVLAKGYLEKLYKEQQGQQSGIFNPETTVEGNNFTAVGYYINLKVTETSLRVQVVNVSTGEYEGNATVNF